jgi:hypothetical protein
MTTPPLALKPSTVWCLAPRLAVLKRPTLTPSFRIPLLVALCDELLGSTGGLTTSPFLYFTQGKINAAHDTHKF